MDETQPKIHTDCIALDELRARHATLIKEREEHAMKARERDIGFAYILGELEQMIKHIEARHPPAGAAE